MNAERLYEWMQDHTTAAKVAAVPIILAMMIGVYGLVQFTGGIKYVYSQSMYVPIILAGVIFGLRGGILAGVVGGIILGPFIPINMVTGEPQDLLNWLYRVAFFVVIGLLIGAASDNTQKYLTRIKWIMSHDVPSELPNRLALIAGMSEINHANDTTTLTALALISVDNVQEIESSYGPGALDAMVDQLASRLQYTLGANTVIYRTNTHQLGVLLLAVEDSNPEALLNEFTNISKPPFSYKDIFIHGDVRIGYAKLFHEEDKPELYLRKAEIALRTASEQSRNWVLFTPQLDTENTKHNLTLLSELKEALDSGQLSLYYQPKINIATGKIQGVEALMRWHHPTRGEIPPDNFIPRAEKSILIDLLTEWAIDTALAQQVKWQNQGATFPVAVNISPRNLMQPGFVDMVIRLLKHHQVDGKFLELEVTEGALMIDMKQTIIKLIELSKVNIIISIDDFGTGYSSLRYLNSLPATIIKVDQSFIHSLSDNTGSKHIVKAAVNLAHELGMTVVGEGVEDKTTYDFLAELGCDVAQGFFINHPLPADDVLQWHQANQSPEKVLI